MKLRTLFPLLVVACFSFPLTATVIAQSSEADTRLTQTNIDVTSGRRLETEISLPKNVADVRPQPVPTAAVDKLLLAAMQSHLGSPYHFTGTGPNSFDCSGFVWRSYQEAGLNFTRGPARSYWALFAAPAKEEQFKFGTLVFFSGLTHVGIVVDEKGFYHSSRHHGVIYSPFNEYWLSRIDGFRRVPPSAPAPPVSAKLKQVKSSVPATVDDDDVP